VTTTLPPPAPPLHHISTTTTISIVTIASTTTPSSPLSLSTPQQLPHQKIHKLVATITTAHYHHLHTTSKINTKHAAKSPQKTTANILRKV
jgi:hypothetical protein